MCCEPARSRSSRYRIARAAWRLIALTGVLWLALSVDARAEEAAVGTAAPIPAATSP